MPVNWPPLTAPSWPPPELETPSFETSDLRTLITMLQKAGFSQANATNAERNLYFRDARCNKDHTVIGRMLVSPSGVRYPFAVCQDPQHRDFLVLWPPYYCGFGSGVE